MKITLPEFSQADVLVIGDVMLDRYWHGPAQRISPEAPVPVIKVETLEERPGGAANVAMNAAALGARVSLVGLTGDDDAAAQLFKILTRVNVDCDFVQIPSQPTITKLRILSRNQQLIRLDFEEPFNQSGAALIRQKMQQKVQKAGAVVLSDYAKGALTDVQSLISIAKEVGVPVVIDPKGTNFERYRGATLLTPNLSEFEAVAGQCKDDQQLVERAILLIQQYELAALLVTRSEYGMTLIQPNKAPLHLPTQAQEVFDVTGAGDTVIGVLASALASHLSLEESCYLANSAAAVVVGKLGTSTVTPAELSNAIHARPNDNFGCVSEDVLEQRVQQARRRGESIVMTNGCFDILHAGHVSYLANAKKLGDRLIVAVNSDSSTRRLKGKTRPINTLENRMRVLAALNSVDWVVAFGEDTPARIIGRILPDMLVKGGDYLPDQVAGGAEVLAHGGAVRILNFEEGISTTQVIEKVILSMGHLPSHRGGDKQ